MTLWYHIRDIYHLILYLFVHFVGFVLVNDKIIFAYPNKQPYLCLRI